MDITVGNKPLKYAVGALGPSGRPYAEISVSLCRKVYEFVAPVVVGSLKVNYQTYR